MYNIAVIGCGVVGISSALQLQKDIQNSKITIFTADVSPNTTGDLSAGLWTPYLLEDTHEDDILRWAKCNHDYFLKLWKAGLCKKTGLSLLPVLSLLTKTYHTLPKWTQIPFGPYMLSKDKVEKLNQQYGKNYTAAFHYLTFTCEPSKLLPYLMQEFLKNGGNIVKKKINNFEELSDFDVIVNCAGLEARKLTNDNAVLAIRGQICRVKAPWIYQAIMDESDHGNYLIPNVDYTIMGGTHQEYDENLCVSLIDKEHIFEGCYKICPGLKTCKEHLDGVGLRPGRNKVRLEGEKLQLKNKTINVVHNYGHGGAGVTLCFGCAKDASVLVKKSLNIPQLASHL